MKTTCKVQFKGLTVNPKNERIATIVIKGDLKDHQILALDKLKGMGACFMDLYSSQTDIDDYSGHDDTSEAEPHKGISYKLEDGAVKVDPNQLSMDEVIQDDEKLVDCDYEVVGEEDELKDAETAILGVKAEEPQELTWLDADPADNADPAADELSDELE